MKILLASSEVHPFSKTGGLGDLGLTITELALAAYRHAVEARYRFYSYGDCMLVV